MTRTLSIVAALTLVAGAAFADGAAIFKSKCALCHGPDGKGQTPVGKSMKARDLGLPEVQKQTDAVLSKIVEDGKGKMPGYKSSLGPDDIKQVVAHIRTFKK
jgi:mono/diheme cytochrome c family protein